MRWYVNRNGQTVGPVEDAEVAQWIRTGMTDATVRDEAGGNWMPLAQSPFASLLPRRTNPLALFGFGLIAFAAIFVTWVAYRYHAEQAHQEAQGGRDVEPEYCAKWGSYYENYCKAYPDHCAEGPKKLARCVPW